MKLWGWILGLVVAAAAACATWWAFTSPAFVAGLVGVVATAAWRWFAPKVFTRMDPKLEADWRDAVRRGQAWDPIKKRAKEPR